MKYIIIASYFFIIQIAFAEYPYEILDSTYTDHGSAKEISPSTPVKSQDGIGLCYGFAVASLLEHYRCKELNLPCTDAKDIVSSLDVSSYDKNKFTNSLKEGGIPALILQNIAKSSRKMAREDCASFAALIHEITYDNVKYKNERIGWSFLSEGWNNYISKMNSGTSNDCVICTAGSIKGALVNLQTPVHQIAYALQDSLSVDQFLYQTLIPKKCLEEDEAMKIPPFVVKTYPTLPEAASDKDSLMSKVTSLLEAGTPLEINMCTSFNVDKCERGHAVSLFGIKEVCSKIKNNCKKMVKVKNSYGKTWQEQNNDGWVELETLIESSIKTGMPNNIIWIENPASTNSQLKDN